MLMGFIIWSLVALLFVGIGISTYRAKDAVGFFTFVEPPKVNDVKKYNHSVAILWFAFTILYEALGIPFLFLEQNSPYFILIILGTFALIIALIIIYIRISIKYKA